MIRVVVARPVAQPSSRRTSSSVGSGPPQRVHADGPVPDLHSGRERRRRGVGHGDQRSAACVVSRPIVGKRSSWKRPSIPSAESAGGDCVESHAVADQQHDVAHRTLGKHGQSGATAPRGPPQPGSEAARPAAARLRGSGEARPGRRPTPCRPRPRRPPRGPSSSVASASGEPGRRSVPGDFNRGSPSARRARAPLLPPASRRGRCRRAARDRGRRRNRRR